ncbi:TIGR03943 family putative permease subunit [Mycolicibacterium palauense]|uniref:TIGR03943 family putative permease subunit n=1 Tax=Mycolicibacterium palauense TaxID=2034511 RepID=UPI000BFEC42C|nr:TIGR03943 family protein [Mycolicibacterium palauense]
MSRETETAMMLLVGVCTLVIAITGSFARYVKPSLLPWLVASAVLLIVLALVSIGRDVHRGHVTEDGHAHRSGVAWLLILPVALLGFVVPPAIGPQTAKPAVREVSTEVLRRPFPALPAERAPELALPEVLVRIAQDSAGTLDGRLISIIGFTMTDGDHTQLGRIVILCCAADASLARIDLDGPAGDVAADLPDGAWVRVEGKIPDGQSDPSRRTTPHIEVSAVEQIQPPANPYSY